MMNDKMLKKDLLSCLASVCWLKKLKYIFDLNLTFEKKMEKDSN